MNEKKKTTAPQIRQVWQVEDGTTYETESDAIVHQEKFENIQRLKAMIEYDMQYCDNQRDVLEFIVDNRIALRKILEKLN